jgi:hypothetical protein
VESDSEVVVKCLQGVLRLAEIENIIIDCYDIMSNLSCSVAFIKRCKNSVAHSLVGVAKQVGSCSWVGYVPEPAASAVCMDLLSLN